jgi:hypothetical protein
VEETQEALLDHEVEPQHVRAEPTGLRNDAIVRRRPLAQAVSDQAKRVPIEHEILGDPEACVPDDVALEILGAIACHVDLDHEVEALAFLGDDPLLAGVRLDVEDGKHVRAEPRFTGVVHGDFRRHVDAPPDRAEEVVERVARLLFRRAVKVALGRVQVPRDVGR